jgi:hypothetical protein
VALVAAAARAVVLGARPDEREVTLRRHAAGDRPVKLGHPVPLSNLALEANSGR